MNEEMRKLIAQLIYCGVKFKVEPWYFTYEVSGRIGEFHWSVFEGNTTNKLNFFSGNPHKRIYDTSAVLCLNLITSEKNDYE